MLRLVGSAFSQGNTISSPRLRSSGINTLGGLTPPWSPCPLLGCRTGEKEDNGPIHLMGNQDDQFKKGDELLRAHRYEAAIRQFDRVLETDPNHGDAHLLRGHCWQRLGEMDNALTDYSHAVRIDPDAANPLVFRGNILRQQGELDRALEDLDEAVRLGPEGALVWQHRALARADREEHEGALADLDEAIRIAPSRADLRFQRGGALHELDRLNEAIRELDTVIEMEPDKAAYRRHRADLLIEADRHDEAEQDLARVQEIGGDESMSTHTRSLIAGILAQHFRPHPVTELSIIARKFPYHLRADLQGAVDGILGGDLAIDHFCGVKVEYNQSSLNLADLVVPSRHVQATSGPPQYEELDIGEEDPVRCLRNGLWVGNEGGIRFAALLAPADSHGCVTGIKMQLATVHAPEGTALTRRLFDRLEAAIKDSRCYRGKILSLGSSNSRFAGMSSGICVHQLRTVERDQVILPPETLELLDRNVVGFTRQRARLAERGLSTRKGVLFYGPPGTGKTHTIHYLARALEGHTTFLVTAEQMGYLDEYVTLARLLQPSVVVIEDVDLIARDRMSTNSPGDHVLLHQLLNEMDGLQPDAEVLFILTTNRAEVLEDALASRPGRIDQAIEFPLPDEEGRVRLIRLYSYGLEVPADLVASTARKTDRVSASFIKELMRRAAQFQIEREEDDRVLTQADIDGALEELLFRGGSLNCKLLGVEERE
jgi:cell division protease FtsH